MTEEQLLSLGFEKVHDEDCYEPEPLDRYHYYVLDLLEELTFITPTNHEIEKDKWWVMSFYGDLHIFDYENLKLLIETINALKV